MPPKKTKAEEAADFLSTLDLDVPEDTPAPSAAATAPSRISADVKRSDASPRASIDSKRSVKSSETARAGSPAPASPSAAGKAGGGAGSGGGKEDEEAQKALDFLEAQINTKRTPLSVPGPASLRAPSPLSGPARSGAQAGVSGSSSSNSSGGAAPANVPTNRAAEEQKQGGGGWGSWWSSASSAIQSAQKIADEGYKKVRTEGVAGLENVKVAGMDLGTLRKGAEERLKGIQLPQGITLPQGIDLEKLRTSMFFVLPSATRSGPYMTRTSLTSRTRSLDKYPIRPHSTDQHRRAPHLGTRDARTLAVPPHDWLCWCRRGSVQGMDEYTGANRERGAYCRLVAARIGRRD